MSRSLPPGLYEALVTDEIAKIVEDLKRERYTAEETRLDPADSHVVLARHLAIALSRVFESFPEDNRIDRQVELTNEIIRLLSQRVTRAEQGAASDIVDSPGRELRALTKPGPVPTAHRLPRPAIPLSEMDLIVNARGEPRVANALAGCGKTGD
jgi:hypothetical protein